MFGKKEEVTETRHMLGAAFGWGGLPVYEAFYITKNEPRKAGDFQLTVKDVPVDGFWSISIYNKDGYFEKNQFDSYSINNLTAKSNEDGSITVNFGESNDGQGQLPVCHGRLELCGALVSAAGTDSEWQMGISRATACALTKSWFRPLQQ